MARQLNNTSSDPVAGFASRLSELRSRSGVTLEWLAAETGLSIGTLSEATGGKRLPSERTVARFVDACGADPLPWVQDRSRLARERRADAAPARADTDRCPPSRQRVWRRWERTGVFTPPSSAHTTEDLGMWLGELRAYAGISLRELARRSGFSHTPMADLEQGRPVSARVLVAFLKGCGAGTFAEQIPWLTLMVKTAVGPRTRTGAERELARLRTMESEASRPRRLPIPRDVPREPHSVSQLLQIIARRLRNDVTELKYTNEAGSPAVIGRIPQGKQLVVVPLLQEPLVTIGDLRHAALPHTWQDQVVVAVAPRGEYTPATELWAAGHGITVLDSYGFLAWLQRRTATLDFLPQEPIPRDELEALEAHTAALRALRASEQERN